MTTIWKRLTNIPVRYIIGTVQHESDFVEDGADINDGGTGRDTIGLTRIDSGETDGVLKSLFWTGKTKVNLRNGEDNLHVYAALCETRLVALKLAAGLTGTDNADCPPDLWAYLAMAHNMGQGAALKSIASYGLDWDAYRARNPGLPFVSKGYGDDVISGGRYWTDDLDSAEEETDEDGVTVEPSTGLLTRLVMLALAAGALWFLFRPALKGLA
jgi:hypothetical protein